MKAIQHLILLFLTIVNQSTHILTYPSLDAGNNLCNINGTLKQSISGECECKTNVIGTLCDECRSGYFSLNEAGCSKCFCPFNGHHLVQKNTNNFDRLNLSQNFEIISNDESICDLAKNLISTKIETNFKSDQHFKFIQFDSKRKLHKLIDSNELDSDHHFNSFKLPSELAFNLNSNTNIQFFKLFKPAKRNNYLEILSDDFYDDQIFYWILDDSFLGFKLNAYDHKLKLKLFYSILRGDVSIDTYKHFKMWPDLILTTNINNETISIGYKKFASKFEPEKLNSIELKLNEQNWFKLNSQTHQLTNKPVDAVTFRLILLNIENFLIRAKYHTDQIESRLYSVQLEHSEPLTSLLLITEHQANLSSFAYSNNQSTTQLNHKFTESKVFKENCTCLEPFTGLTCSECKLGYFMVIHFNDHLTRKFEKDFLLECRSCDCNGHQCDAKGRCLFDDHLTQANRPESEYHLDSEKVLKKKTDLMSDKTNLINNQRCTSSNCSQIGSLNNNHDGFTSDRKSGFVSNGCFSSNCSVDLRASYNECVSKLVESIEEFGFEHKFKLVDLDIAKHRPLAFLSNFELKLHQLENRNEVLIKFKQQYDKVNLELANLTKNFKNQLKNSDDLFELLNEGAFDTLVRHLTDLSRKSESLSFKSEFNLVKSIDIRNQISEEIDELVVLKHQRLFDDLEIKKFHFDSNILLKRMKKYIKEDFYLSKKEEITRELDQSITLNKKVIEFYHQISSRKKEIIDEFNRLFKIDIKLVEVKKYIENDLESKIDSILRLNKQLNAQFGSIEQLKNDVDEEFAQIEQGIVDASYMNNISLILSKKIEDNFYEFEYKLSGFGQNQVKGLAELLIRLQPDNEMKYVQMCKVNLMNMKADLNMIEKTISNEYIDRNFLIDLITNQTHLINSLQINLNQFKDLEFYIENEFEQYDLSFKKKIETDKNLTTKSNQLTESTNYINLNLIDLERKLESIELRLNTIKNNSFIIDELDGNIKYRNKLLISIEQDLNNLTKKSIISKYIDNFVSPVSALKSLEHNRTLSYLNKELMPDYLKRLSNLKENLEFETLNATLDQNVQQIRNNIQTKKKYLQSFELRNKKIDTINQHVKLREMKADNLIQQARQRLSSIKMSLGMKYFNDENRTRLGCKRSYSISLEPSSMFSVSFFYSVADLANSEKASSYFKFTDSLDDHWILMIGSLDKQYILFELENGQVKVSWRFVRSSNLLSSLKLKKNDENFKNKDAYYKIEFVKSVQEAYLKVSSFRNHQSDEKKVELDDLILKLESERLEMGDISGNVTKSTKEFMTTISGLEINNKSIGLWNYETTTGSCSPMKEIASYPNSNNVFIFNGKDSYLQFRQVNRYEKHKYSVGIEFRTFSPNGILFITFNESSKNLVSIFLRNGHLEFVVLTSKYKLNLRTANRYDNGIWHSLLFDRENYLSVARTDEEELEGCLKEHNEELINLVGYLNQMGNKTNDLDCSNSAEKLEMNLEHSSIFIGGLEDLFTFKHFNGAIKQIQVEATLINLNNNLNSLNVEESLSASSLIRKMKFNSAESFVEFSALQFKNWSNFGFTFKISNGFTQNCSILSLLLDSESSSSKMEKREIALNLINNKLVFTVVVNDEFNSTMLNSQDYRLNDNEYHSILLINKKSSVNVVIDNKHQTEVLENIHFENLANLIEELKVLRLGLQTPSIQINDEELNLVNLANLFFIGTVKEFVLNNELINLDSHFVQMNEVELLSD